MALVYDSLYIGGRWVAPASTKTIDVVSASTEEPIGRVPEAVEDDIDAAVAAARAAFDDPAGWSGWEPGARADAIERLAVALDARSDEMARRVSNQNGMPITIATGAEGAFPQLVLRYYANLIRTAVLDEVRDGMLGGKIRVRRAPDRRDRRHRPLELPDDTDGVQARARAGDGLRGRPQTEPGNSA
ncbi:aldehyde dehydrogenase family protein [Amycolatopsis sp. NPDC051758]|uniref:aldehyde dehydrogenase family protein n=1 Tax=Amycolatopsis sp. NPDC051758 TaxID=3363935 RepID=UPI0037A4ED81